MTFLLSHIFVNFSVILISFLVMNESMKGFDDL